MFRNSGYALLFCLWNHDWHVGCNVTARVGNTLSETKPRAHCFRCGGRFSSSVCEPLRCWWRRRVDEEMYHGGEGCTKTACCLVVREKHFIKNQSNKINKKAMWLEAGICFSRTFVPATVLGWRCALLSRQLPSISSSSTYTVPFFFPPRLCLTPYMVNVL